ncbi:MAG TPA: biotin-dependent carboxyltransferase family protein [Candidatus Acidoferrum sp.]|nr:biotin-dependent carboxyltransferase family protein [Candidatus Acidoferrum sp.]
MKTLQILRAGPQTTVQDLGREGFGPIGVSASGAADPISLRIGNRLVGNPENAAALEMTLLGDEIQFSRDALIALTGANLSAASNSSSLPMYESFRVKSGQTLKLGHIRSGVRSYLCIAGGIAVTPFLGSRSTHLLSGLGGHLGRPLQRGDSLPIGIPSAPFKRRKIASPLDQHLAPRKILRVTKGPQWQQFSSAAQHLFFSQSYTVTQDASRMGVRLQAEPLAMSSAGEMLTEGVSLGAIQITPSGQPIILFVEQQTTGGYPKIANVIAADIASVGQLTPREQIRFELVTLEFARAALLQQERLLTSPELIEE